MTFLEILTTPVIPDETVVNNGLYPDPEMERDEYEAPNVLAGFDHNSQDIFELLKTMQGAQPFPQTAPATPVPESTLSKFVRSKVPIVVLAVFVYVAFAFDLDFLFGGAVFSSLIVWEVLELFLTTFVIKGPVQQGGLVNLLFVFGGVSQQKSQFILRLLGLTNKILRDIAIFMFTFVLVHLIWSSLIVGESLIEILDKDFSNLLKGEL